MSIANRVKEIISCQLGVNIADLMPEIRFTEDLGADSLDEVELIFDFEDEFDLEISDDAAAKIKTVQQAIDYLTAKVPQK